MDAACLKSCRFRRLVLENSARQDEAPRPSATPVLGARKPPMTPRHVGGSSTNAEFARQLAERNAKVNPSRRFKASAPKGVKLAAGYVDRTKHLVDDEEDEKAQRIKALEEAMKLGQIDRGQFDQMVLEIAGGDLSSTHLVKGLDRKLLERVRKGEDIFGSSESPPKEDEAAPSDAEDEFDDLEKQEVAPIAREKVEKKGQAAPTPPPIAGQKRSRDVILAELKAQRKAAAEAAEAERQKLALGKGFRKIGVQGEKSWIETDKNGREILIIRDADGKEKRKIRKQRVEEQPIEHEKLEMLDGDQKALNLHNIPAPPTEVAEEEEDEDIFQGVGSTFNPLAGLVDEDDSSEGEKPQTDTSKANKEADELEEGEEQDEDTPVPSLPTSKPEDKTSAPPPRRNWFGDNASSSKPEVLSTPAAADATVLAALRKVRQMDPESSLLQTEEEQARLKKRAALLAAADRDMEDMDMGFGASRFDDAEDMEREGDKVKFSEWKGSSQEAEEGRQEKEGG
ncbi:hypothetical protein BCR34DRAFT_592279 [Clohesyomyces aquaticus]|uniref:RED-like N-terminal domain-containing protein n=1 Tax=Clohesyomyces aquaticus TaxID=1231657 RepID=A0A1Y1YTN7_9PLEO|nr:hypothetical protein BCR34DRAFT_592279 [Clohesyomyces aquaticus]